MNTTRLLSAAILLGSLPLQAAPPAPAGREPGERPSSQRQFLERMFKKLDTDGDKTISFEEFKANSRLERASEEQKQKLFSRIDKNKDGLIQRVEIRPPQYDRRRPFHRKGPVSFEEFKQEERIANLPEDVQHRLFSRMDRNNDGVIDKKDFPPRNERHKGPRDQRKGRPGLPNLKKWDADQDGSVSFTEFRQAPQHANLDEDAAEDRFEELDKNGRWPTLPRRLVAEKFATASQAF